jgi:hypothetical protein
VTAIAFAGTPIAPSDFFGIIIAIALAAYLVVILIRQGRV